VAIVVFGEQPYAEFEGDRETLEFSPNDKRELSLLRDLHAAGVPTVAVFLSGRPLWVNPEINASDAFVAAWLPGSEGEGIADVLFQSSGTPPFDFRGRLSFSWPQSAMPVAFDSSGNAAGALFARGFGLDYQSTSQSTHLSENPIIPPSWRASPGSLFHSGHPTSPWSIFVADGSDEVRLTNVRQESPHAAIAVELAPQDGTVTAKWAGTASGTLKFSGRPTDLRTPAKQGAAIELHYRVDRAPDRRVGVGTLSGAMLDLTRTFKTATPGQWHTLSIPLSCLAAAGADLKEVAVPLAIETSGRFDLSISEARLSTQARDPECTSGSTG
jgi:beta-glucosidase